MARQFNGSTQAMQSTSTCNLSAAGTGQITIAFWLWWDTFANNDSLAMEASANSNSNPGSFIINPNDSGFTTFGFGHIGSGVSRYVTIARPSAAAWHHYMLVIDTTDTANFVAYVDGSSVTVTSRANTGGTTWGNFTINAMARNAASLFAAGRMAGLGIWTSALTGGNATSLSGGAAPSTIGSPAFSWNLCATTSPEPAANGGITMTLVAAPSGVSDPSAFSGVCGASGLPYFFLETCLHGNKQDRTGGFQ